MIFLVKKIGESTYIALEVEAASAGTSKLKEKINLSSHEEYLTWKESATSSGAELRYFGFDGNVPEPGEEPLESIEPAGTGATESSDDDASASEEAKEPASRAEQKERIKNKTKQQRTNIDRRNLENKEKGRDRPTTNTGKAVVDLTSFTDAEKRMAELGPNSGFLNRKRVEPVPKFKPCLGDTVYNGINNQWIILGRDRPGSFTSGYGPGKGHTQAGAIDIVVGRMAPHPRKRNRDNTLTEVSPIFNYENHEGRTVCDAARIYVSQKTDIDSNFSLADGAIGNSRAISAIGLKADAIRIISRGSGIKLVTHSPQLMNSQGATSNRLAPGVDIIAGNNHDNLQPMVLGHNLRDLLREHHQAISDLAGVIASIVENISKLDIALVSHTHPQSFPPGLPTIPDANLMLAGVESITRLVSLDAFSVFGAKFGVERLEKLYLGSGASKGVLSKHNNVN